VNYYNELDPKAAGRLRSLISAGFIPPGHVDERSIADVRPSDLEGFTQCHFFAGIGGWSEALRIAGVSSDTRLWTGSCPCQPFSSAGRRKGIADERHLWPVFRDLIAECQPPIVFGEQVASADGRDWLAVVRAEMEALGYAVGAADLCAAGVGAPHIRQRLWFVGLGHTYCPRHEGDGLQEIRPGREAGREVCGASGSGTDSRMANGDSKRHDREPVLLRTDSRGRITEEISEVTGSGGNDGMANGDSTGSQGRPRMSECAAELSAGEDGMVSRLENDGRTSTADSFWGASDWLFCRDGLWRPVESGTFPLVDGVPGRVAHLRGYGNAIVPQVAATFIQAALNT
jgi:DNA (cytosine-5)-methyltransferase 1